jgi:tetratricopeptide (TPR) repeat protein
METEDLKTEQQIDQYVTGRLKRWEADRLWDTLMLEPDKLSYLKVSAALHKMYAANAAPVIYLRRLIAIAAALLLFAVAINLFRYSEADYVNERLIISSIDDTGFESLYDLRDTATPLTEEDSLFNEALNLSFAGALDRAKESFEALVQKYPFSVSAPKAWMNIGIILYNKGEFSEATDALQRALGLDDGKNRFFREKILWFQANAYFRTNRLIEARSAAWQAVQLDGSYQEQALELVRYLDYRLGLTDTKPAELN